MDVEICELVDNLSQWDSINSILSIEKSYLYIYSEIVRKNKGPWMGVILPRHIVNTHHRNFKMAK